jgi:hypothetical protein
VRRLAGSPDFVHRLCALGRQAAIHEVSHAKDGHVALAAPKKRCNLVGGSGCQIHILTQRLAKAEFLASRAATEARFEKTNAWEPKPKPTAEAKFPSSERRSTTSATA